MLIKLFALYDGQDNNVLEVVGEADSIKTLFYLLTVNPDRALIRVTVDPPCHNGLTGDRIEKWERPE